MAPPLPDESPPLNHVTDGPSEDPYGAEKAQVPTAKQENMPSLISEPENQIITEQNSIFEEEGTPGIESESFSDRVLGEQSQKSKPIQIGADEIPSEVLESQLIESQLISQLSP